QYSPAGRECITIRKGINQCITMLLITNNEELANLTGSWYENNVFERIVTDIKNETYELGKLIGSAIITKAEEIAGKEEPSPEEVKTLEFVKTAIALASVYRYFQSNLVSHEGNGRKKKIDAANEKIAWEWEIERDDQSHLIKVQQAQDQLIEWLEEKNIAGFNQSGERQEINSLFLNNTRVFNYFFPIDNSARF